MGMLMSDLDQQAILDLIKSKLRIEEKSVSQYTGGDPMYIHKNRISIVLDDYEIGYFEIEEK